MRPVRLVDGQEVGVIIRLVPWPSMKRRRWVPFAVLAVATVLTACSGCSPRADTFQLGLGNASLRLPHPPSWRRSDGPNSGPYSITVGYLSNEPLHQTCQKGPRICFDEAQPIAPRPDSVVISLGLVGLGPPGSPDGVHDLMGTPIRVDGREARRSVESGSQCGTAGADQCVEYEIDIGGAPLEGWLFIDAGVRGPDLQRLTTLFDVAVNQSTILPK
jgi:hypothetical protein